MGNPPIKLMPVIAAGIASISVAFLYNDVPCAIIGLPWWAGIPSKLIAFYATVIMTLFLALYSGLVSKTGLFKLVDTKSAMLKGAYPAFHRHEQWGFSVEQMPALKGHTFVVTGANTGIGFCTAKHLARAGGRVILACRSLEKAEDAAKNISDETQNQNVVAMKLDLASFASIRAFAKEFKEREGQLNSLILNAGIMLTPYGLTEDGIEQQIGVNHFGHALLTKELLPMLEESATAVNPSTVVVVSSSNHYQSYPEGVRATVEELNDPTTYSMGFAYGQSKLANLLFGQELSHRCKDKNVLVNICHPGACDTELKRHLFAKVGKVCGGGCARWLQWEHDGLYQWLPKDAALTLLYCAVSTELKANKITGQYYHPIARPHTPCKKHGDFATNAELRKKVWNMTEEFIASH